MSPVENKALVLRWFEVVSTNANIDVNKIISRFDEFFTADYTLHHFGLPDFVGKEGFIKYMQVIKNMTAFQFKIDDLFGEGDKLANPYSGSYTQASTGEQMAFANVSIYRFANGKFAEEWEWTAEEKR
jgi:predicted SnoaL-like aldol condensation-catalyzing enzyme